ncbi:MAG: ABC transporter ATP-binding protein [bacterium]|nr:ABC transporter ATP-binding protein [bacterium]
MHESRQAALRCTGLIKRYEDVIAVAGLDLEVRRGECFGLLGPNGAGKTTTVEILEGLLDPDEGVVQVLGRSWGRGSRDLRQRLGIQLQEAQFTEKLSVAETIRLFRSFYDRGHDPESVLRRVSLEPKADTWVGKLSGGQKQRLSLACALVSQPEILFLDEPTTGLDPQSRRQCWEVIERFKTGGGTVLLTTHYMEEAEKLCDRVGVIDHGRMIAQGSPRELIASLGAEHVVEFEAAGAGDPMRFAELDGVCAVSAEDGVIRLTVTEVHRAVPALLRTLGDKGSLERLTTHHATLEDVFMHLTGRHLRDE